MKKGPIRSDVDQKKSDIVGSLEVGEVFESLEEKINDAGQRRVRMERGWVSVTSASGKPLCVSEAAVQQFLASVPLLQALTEASRAKLADVLEAVQVEESHSIVTEGEVGVSMFFIEQGQAKAVIKGGQTVKEYCEGDWFGELALMNDAPRSASVIAVAGTLRCLELGRDAFKTIIAAEGEVELELVARNADYQAATAAAEPATDLTASGQSDGDLFSSTVSNGSELFSSAVSNGGELFSSAVYHSEAQQPKPVAEPEPEPEPEPAAAAAPPIPVAAATPPPVPATTPTPIPTVSAVKLGVKQFKAATEVYKAWQKDPQADDIPEITQLFTAALATLELALMETTSSKVKDALNTKIKQVQKVLAGLEKMAAVVAAKKVAPAIPLTKPVPPPLEPEPVVEPAPELEPAPEPETVETPAGAVTLSSSFKSVFEGDSSDEDGSGASPNPEIIAVTLTEPGPLGLKFTPNKQTGNIELLRVNADTQAETHPQLSAGLILQSVAGALVADMEYEEVVGIIKECGRPITMTFTHGGTVATTLVVQGREWPTEELPAGQYFVRRGDQLCRLHVLRSGVRVQPEDADSEATILFSELKSWFDHGVRITISTKQSDEDMVFTAQNSTAAHRAVEAVAFGAMRHLQKNPPPAEEPKEPKQDARSSARGGVASLRGLSAAPPAAEGGPPSEWRAKPKPKGQKGGPPPSSARGTATGALQAVPNSKAPKRKGSGPPAPKKGAAKPPTIPKKKTAPPAQYRVLVNCTVRKGPENDSEKLGEHIKGTVVDVVDTAVNSDGLGMIQTSTPPAGWVKLKTSKGRKQLERVTAAAPQKGDHVTWTKSDSDVQEGSVGQVIRNVHDGRLQVHFNGKDFNFRPDDLVVVAHPKTSEEDADDVPAAAAPLLEAAAEAEVDPKEPFELAVREFLQEVSPDVHVGRVIVALSTTWDSPAAWLPELKAMREDGSLPSFLKACSGEALEEKEEEEEQQLLQYKVLATSTVRIGPNSDSTKVGEFKAGAIIAVVQEAVNSDGLKVVHTITACPGAKGTMGGWVKFKTSKGKALLTLYGATATAEDGAPDNSPATGRRRSITELVTGSPKPVETPKRKSPKADGSKADEDVWDKEIALSTSNRSLGQVYSVDLNGAELRLQIGKEQVQLYNKGAKKHSAHRYEAIRSGDGNVRTCSTGLMISLTSGYDMMYTASVKDARIMMVQIQTAIKLFGTHLPGGWHAGDLVDVDGEDGWEFGATILGRPKGKDVDELQVRFADGVVDDWPYEDFRKAQPKPEAVEGAASDDAAAESQKTSTGDQVPDASDADAAFMAGFKGLGERRYNEALEAELRGWMAEQGVSAEGGDFMAALKSGILLCELANALQPGVVTAKISAAAMPFKQMENIGHFLAAAETLGVQASDRFQTVDLYESKQPAQVLLCLQVLKRVTTTPAAPGKKGPPPSSVKASKCGHPPSTAPGTAAVASGAKPVISRGKGKAGPKASKKPAGKRKGPPPLMGKAAAAELQKEIMTNGTNNVKKIESLRRASLIPDGDMAAAAAAAAAEMEELEEGDKDDDEDDDEDLVRVVLTEGGSLGLSFILNEQDQMTLDGVKPGGQAARASNADELVPGLLVESVGGVSVKDLAYREALGMVQAAGRPVEIVFSQDPDV